MKAPGLGVAFLHPQEQWLVASGKWLVAIH